LGTFAFVAGRFFLAGKRPAFLLLLLDTTVLPAISHVNSIATISSMDFKIATDRLTDRVTADDIARAFKVARNTIARARLDPSSSAYRSPPDGWRKVLARLAKARSRELKALADELERSSE
jgi:hypothetical protein